MPCMRTAAYGIAACHDNPSTSHHNMPSQVAVPQAPCSCHTAVADATTTCSVRSNVARLQSPKSVARIGKFADTRLLRASRGATAAKVMLYTCYKQRTSVADYDQGMLRLVLYIFRYLPPKRQGTTVGSKALPTMPFPLLEYSALQHRFRTYRTQAGWST